MTTDLDRLIEAVEGDCVNWLGWARRDDVLSGELWAVARDADRGSLDAAVMLHDALLPSAVWGRSLDGVMWVSLSAKTVSIYGFYRGNSDSPARSLLLATLRAYRSTREGW